MSGSCAGCGAVCRGAQIVIADCGLTAEARGLADYLAEREDNAAVVNGTDFRLDAGNER